MAPTFPEKNVEKNLEEGMFPWLTVDKKMTLDKEKLRMCNIWARLLTSGREGRGSGGGNTKEHRGFENS